MRDHYEISEIIELAEKGRSASFIKERLALRISVRQVQRLVSDRLGRRPSRQAIVRRDVLRSRVVSYMESQGLHRFYCSVHQHPTIEPCFIRELSKDESLDSIVFVCRQGSTVADV